MRAGWEVGTVQYQTVCAEQVRQLPDCAIIARGIRIECQDSSLSATTGLPKDIDGKDNSADEF